MKLSETKLQAFIKKCKVAYLGSIDEDGYPNIKTMLFPRKVEGMNIFYFSTNTSSLRVKQFQKNPKACIYFNNTLLFKGAMITGHVEVLHDSEIKEELWEKGDTQYYPLGVTDPDYCVLKLTANNLDARCYRIQ